MISQVSVSTINSPTLLGREMPVKFKVEGNTVTYTLEDHNYGYAMLNGVKIQYTEDVK